MLNGRPLPCFIVIDDDGTTLMLLVVAKGGVGGVMTTDVVISVIVMLIGVRMDVIYGVIKRFPTIFNVWSPMSTVEADVVTIDSTNFDNPLVSLPVKIKLTTTVSGLFLKSAN